MTKFPKKSDFDFGPKPTKQLFRITDFGWTSDKGKSARKVSSDLTKVFSDYAHLDVNTYHHRTFKEALIKFEIYETN